MKLAWLPVTGTCDRGTSPGKQSIGRPLRELRTCYSGERKSSQSLDLDIMEQNEALAANELGDHVGDVEGKQIETLLSSRFWRLFVSNEVRSVDRPFRCKLFLDLTSGITCFYSNSYSVLFKITTKGTGKFLPIRRIGMSDKNQKYYWNRSRFFLKLKKFKVKFKCSESILFSCVSDENYSLNLSWKRKFIEKKLTVNRLHLPALLAHLGYSSRPG